MTTEPKPIPPMPKFGCHCDLEPGQLPDGCVLDYGRPEDCIYAKRGTKREECEYWLPCEQTEEARKIDDLSSRLEAAEAVVEALNPGEENPLTVARRLKRERVELGTAINRLAEALDWPSINPDRHFADQVVDAALERIADSSHLASRLEASQAIAGELAEALRTAKDAMDERRSYVDGGDPATSWQEMKYGEEWDREDARVDAALAKWEAAK